MQMIFLVVQTPFFYVFNVNDLLLSTDTIKLRINNHNLYKSLKEDFVGLGEFSEF